MHFKYKDTGRLKVKKWKKCIPNTNQKKAGMATRQISKYEILPGIKEVISQL